MALRIGVALALGVALAGCANLNSIYREFDVAKAQSPMVDVRQRAIMVAPDRSTVARYDSAGQVVSREERDDGVIVCAEPSPDAMAAFAYEVAAKASTKGVSGEFAAAMQDSAAFIGLRTQSIQLLRDFGYRLCESYMSGAITRVQYDLLMRRFQKNTVALLAIEQLTGAIRAAPIALTSQGGAEIAKSLAEQRAEREKINDQVAELEKQKAAATGDTTEIDGKIARLKSDRDTIDKAIANTKDILVSGKTEVKIETSGLPTQRSDEHIQKVADVVGKIVGDIVLSDDKTQMCMSALQSPVQEGDAGAKRFATWCQDELDNDTKAYRLQLVEVERAQRALIGASPSDKRAREHELKSQHNRLQELEIRQRLYGIRANE